MTNKKNIVELPRDLEGEHRCLRNGSAFFYILGSGVGGGRGRFFSTTDRRRKKKN